MQDFFVFGIVMTHRSFIFCYACSHSLLLTALCCDDIHDVTPRGSALAGCDIFVSEDQIPRIPINAIITIIEFFAWIYNPHVSIPYLYHDSMDDLTLLSGVLMNIGCLDLLL
nr:hypothetical protein [Tanacetum cinerariifolium]